jgi:S-adenosylmethionine decarboxylase
VSNGRHLILDLYGCTRESLDNYQYLEQMLQTAVRMSGATLLRITGHKFEPEGVTILALLAESHASIHTWPSQKYAAVDLYTCNPDGIKAQKAADFIKHKLQAQDIEEQEIERKVQR